MSLPIPNLALVHGATQLATHVAGRVGKAMGFDEVLRGGNAAAPTSAQQADSAQQIPGIENTDVVPKIDDLHARISSRIRSLMREAGMAVSGALKIRFDSRQNLNVDNPHPSGAGIEELLNRDPALKQDFESLASLTARNAFSIDLTSHGPVANINAPGGYPNW
ncbi:hypothetical protein OAF83_00615 [Rubripirellula sp.]|nr:hypothetical protein [Rubripirellula sp.]MDB4749383.1 hypothetical protein [Rubripirellula sp.]